MIEELTPRQKQIARMLCQQMTYTEIAKELNAPIQSIKNACGFIYKKLNVANQIELVVLLSAPLDSPFRKMIEDNNSKRG